MGPSRINQTKNIVYAAVLSVIILMLILNLQLNSMKCHIKVQESDIERIVNIALSLKPLKNDVFEALVKTNQTLSLPDYRKNETLLLGKIFDKSQLELKNYEKQPDLIPKIIHQIWDTRAVPGMYKAWIQSVLAFHPGWEYWFWTKEDMDFYVKTRFPAFYTLFRSYKATVLQANLLRYMVMYDLGGIYIDLDMKALKALDVWTKISSVILSQENYEHTFLAYKKKEANVMNTVIAAAPRHPLFERVLDVEKLNSTTKDKNFLNVNGVNFFNSAVQKYIKETHMKEWNKDLMLIHPKYWLPVYDKPRRNTVRNECIKILQKRPTQSIVGVEPILIRMLEDLCRDASAKQFSLDVDKDSFLNHYWVHAVMWKEAKKIKDTINITAIAGSRYENVTEKLCRQSPEQLPKLGVKSD